MVHALRHPPQDFKLTGRLSLPLVLQVEKPTFLVKAIQKVVETSGFDAGQLVRLLTYAGDATTKMLLEHPEKLAGSMVLTRRGCHFQGTVHDTLLRQQSHHHPGVGGACILGRCHPDGCSDVRFTRRLVTRLLG